MHKTLIAGAAVAALMTGARPAAADVFDPLLTASCPGVVDVEVGAFRADIGHVYENSLFASGSLWVTDSSDTAVKRFAPDGTLIGIVPGPGGGLAEGERGEIYAGVGNDLPGAALESGASSVVRFDPDAGPDQFARVSGLRRSIAISPSFTSFDTKSTCSRTRWQRS